MSRYASASLHVCKASIVFFVFVFSLEKLSVYISHAQLCTFGSNQATIGLQKPRDEMVGVCV